MDKWNVIGVLGRGLDGGRIFMIGPRAPAQGLFDLPL